MYARFTSRARKAIRVATQVAKKSRQPHLDIEHLQLAVLQSEDGGAAAVLNALGVDKHVQLIATEALILPASDPKPAKKLPLALRAKRAITYAITVQMYITEQNEIGDVGTEDLLLGIVCEGESKAAQLLARFGLTRIGVRAQIRQLAARHD